MADKTIVRRYASAFMDLLGEPDEVQAHVRDLQACLDLLRSHDGALLAALHNPVFTLDERRGVLQAVLQRQPPRPLVASLLQVLLDKGRMAALPEITEECVRILDERAGRARVRVETAEPLSPQLEAEVRDALERVTGKTVLLETAVEPELIGGMVARVGGTLYDASLRTRLRDLEQRLINAQVLPEA